jgi:chromosome segregation ATPase
MGQDFEKLTDNINEIKTMMNNFSHILDNIEKRLSRLEQMDSIEHRVEVNQIDLSDIKESLERIEEIQRTENKEEIQHINRRLDSHLVKLAKAEEEIIILKNR